MKLPKGYMIPYVRVAMHDTPGDFVFNRFIFDFELIYIENGTVQLEIENQVFNCTKGDIIFLKPGIQHKLSAVGNVEQPHIHFDFVMDEYSDKIYIPLENDINNVSQEQKKWIRSDYLKENNISIPYVLKLNKAMIIRDLLYKIIEEYNYPTPHSVNIISYLTIKLITELFKCYDEQSNSFYNKHKDLFDRIVRYVYQNSERMISLDELSEYALISKYYLIKIFKKAFNKSPYQYIYEVKIKKAKELIQFTKMSLKEIAYKMGFDNQQAFCRWFQNYDGKSPNLYRKG